MTRARIVFMGSPEFAVPTLAALSGHPAARIVGVVTQPDRPKGRGRALAPSPVKQAALRLGVPIFEPVRLRKDQAVIDALNTLAPDLIVVVAYGQILPREVLAIPHLGCVNVHASLLPKYRGAAPIAWALANGERETGVTLMQMDEGLDTGPMLGAVKLVIGGQDTTGSLTEKLAALGAEALGAALDDILAARRTPVAQEAAAASYARLLKKSDGRVDFHKSAAEVRNWIAAMDPWPGAFGALEGAPLKLFRAVVPTADAKLVQPEVTAPSLEDSAQVAPGPIAPGQVAPGQVAPGSFIGTDEHGLCVACGDGYVSVGELQLPGRKRMSASAFLAGVSLPGGTQLEAKKSAEEVVPPAAAAERK